MSLDGFALRALTTELAQNLTDGRVDKIQQIDKLSVLFTIRAHGENKKLLLSVHPQTARVNIITESMPTLPQPPLFCMVLRKHLEGSKILSIRQLDYERIIHITFSGYNEIGEQTTRVLICEIMGKHSNIILLNPDNNTILDSIRHLGIEQNQYRQIMPGLPYLAPPAQNKTSIDTLTMEEMVTWFMESDSRSGKILLNHLAGAGPQTVRELLYRANIDDDMADTLGQYEYNRLWQEILTLRNMINANAWQPTIIKNDSAPIAFAPFALKQFYPLEQISYNSFNKLLEDYIGTKESANTLEQKRTELEHILQRELDRCYRKAAIQEETIASSQDAELYKKYGELITANLYQIKQGSHAEVIDYYDEHCPTVTIPMEGHLSPNENAQRYFKKYTKAKIGAEKAAEQLLLTNDEIAYLESISNGLTLAQNLADISEIRMELESAGYVKAKLTKQNKKGKQQISHQIMSIQQDGFEILIGKNNVQNDYLTLKIAKLTDTWLHAKDIPGSHVIIRAQNGQNIPKKIMDLAANFAAYFSKARNSSLVPVDYTLRKYVRKPNGAKPGRVIYDNQKTIYITPDEDIVTKLLK